MSIKWADYSLYNNDGMPSDWCHVVSLEHGNYEWSTFHAFYSPRDRRYFWHGGSGCSCNYWGEELYTPADFENGNKADLARALRNFADENNYCFNPSTLVDVLRDLARFTPTKTEDNK